MQGLVTQWPSSPILFCAEERPLFVAQAFEIGPELLHETRIIEQDRPPLVAFSHDSQVFVVEREIDIFDIQGESLVVSSDDLLPGSTLRSSELTLIMYGCIGAERRSSYIITDP